ncbi:MAG: ankyrin repeat domain-containing protein [Acidobacteria bacterium]|nr:ankyrin repeat domain-containing protein [Acidobacteriota bacterium]
MLKRKNASFAFLFVLFITFGRASAADLFEAIRNGDAAAVRAGAQDPAVRERRGLAGATPLLYAAAFGNAESVRTLTEAGAALDARTDLGATALIWAAGDAAKTRILVEAGAEVNVRSNTGKTPLLLAAARAGSVETVRLLLDKGADVKAADEMGGTALLAAALMGEDETVRLLLDRGADPNQADKAGMTPLQNAAANQNRAMMRMLLAKGARVNDANVFGGQVKHGEVALKGLTPLMLAAPHGSPSTLRVLLDAGAEINGRDSRGMTPLLLAAASSRQDRRTIKLLLERGADPKAVSMAGETARDWAAKYGDPGVMALLEAAGAERKAQVVAAPTAVRMRETRDAVIAALGRVQASEAEFFRESGCVACHHQGMAQIATASARRAGVEHDEAAVQASVGATVALFGAYAPMLLDRNDLPGTPDTPTFALFALALQEREADFATDALFANIAAQQRADGSWKLVGFSRAPLEESHFGRTAQAVRALTRYAPPARQAEMRQRRAAALAWLTRAKPRTTDDYAWRLAGLDWAGASSSVLAQAARELRAMQRADGGWGPSKTMASDAYTTGLALWALHESIGMAPNTPAYRPGVRYLLRTQRPDGTWFVASRAVKFQPYFESGFPYGPDQWVSISATAWAAAALAPAAEPAAASD